MMTLELGDHVWYWNGQMSQDQNIPRSSWFPTSNPKDPTDYLGNGKDIYQYVVHANEVARGRPHMRNHPGSYAWLNNNPGNITGQPGGPDFGQYSGKFNWHNFLVFPSWDAGFAAIGMLLQTSSYIDLSIGDALQRYAPASDGNDPVKYAQEVATAAGVPVTTTIRELGSGLQLMQEKIQQIEGVIPGDSLPWDSADIPEPIRAQLP